MTIWLPKCEASNSRDRNEIIPSTMQLSILARSNPAGQVFRLSNREVSSIGTTIKLICQSSRKISLLMAIIERCANSCTSSTDLAWISNATLCVSVSRGIGKPSSPANRRQRSRVSGLTPGRPRNARLTVDLCTFNLFAMLSIVMDFSRFNVLVAKRQLILLLL
ncbi:hypothetical protein SDC9_192549 [bioreactor metagenome]|uniref:Uncharacterized protein n=1 Tax=bioreactor metagenome TaxID=1076179 RepID=A0A645I2K5_9ZZZZ